MSMYEIQGGRPLGGRLRVQGAKNSVLPLLAAALLAPGQSVIHNCPDLSDVSATLDILALLGCRVAREGETVTVDAAALSGSAIPKRLMREMRSSVIFLGALLARTGSARLCYPGGCELGPRPIDLHLAALRGLGAEIREDGECLTCTASRGLRGARIHLPFPSVGATENAMLCACGAQGVTTLVGAAREPEIVDLERFLNKLGARVSGAGTPVVTIEGGRPLHGAEHTVMGDRIVASTWLCACGAAGGEIALTGVEPSSLDTVLSCLEQAGGELECRGEEIRFRSTKPLRGIPPVHTAPYPGFPTDAQAILMAALAGGIGQTLFVENMFESRYRHVAQLQRMGADIRVWGRSAVVTGRPLHGQRVESTDLRGGAALVVAALGAEGTTQVTQLSHIRRGYQDMEGTLQQLGADIRLLPTNRDTGEDHGICETQPKAKTPPQPAWRAL